jgi:site-specific DNA-methyltransferase (adenine-specific)
MYLALPENTTPCKNRWNATIWRRMRRQAQLLQGDCLELMPELADKSIDMILCDLPYGTTACKWDVIIPFEPLWAQYKRIIKDNGAIVLFGREPFTSKLIVSNLNCYKHKWVWNKKQMGNYANAKYMPLQIEEDIVVFAKGRVNYYPEMRTGKLRKKGGGKKQCMSMSSFIKPEHFTVNDQYYPVNLLEDFPNCSNKNGRVHPTQKPVPLLEYLIKTYTNEGDLVLDNCMGSGSTGVACKNLDRDFIGMELNEKYCEIAKNRINNLVTW